MISRNCIYLCNKQCMYHIVFLDQNFHITELSKSLPNYAIWKMGHPSLYFLKVLCNPSWHNSSRNIIYLSSHTIPQSSLTYSPLRKNFFTTTHIRNIAFTSLHCPPKPEFWRNCWPYCSLTRPLWVEFPVKWADTPQMQLVLSDSGGTHWQ